MTFNSDLRIAAGKLVDTLPMKEAKNVETLKLAYESILDPSKAEGLPQSLKAHSQRIRALIDTPSSLIDDKVNPEEFKNEVFKEVARKIAALNKLLGPANEIIDQVKGSEKSFKKEFSLDEMEKQRRKSNIDSN